MADAGEKLETVNAQRFDLIQNTNSLTFKQTHGLQFRAERPVYKHTLTDGTIDIQAGTGGHVIEADILVTTPEISTLINYTDKSSNGTLPSKEWKVMTTDRSGTIDTLKFTGKVISLQLIRRQLGAVWFHITIQTTDDEVSESA